jgi:hypothetical protein
MDEHKKIKDVIIGNLCHKSLPCSHNIIEIYTDGTQQDKGLVDANKIYNRYKKYTDVSHFKGQSETSLSGLYVQKKKKKFCSCW